MNVLKIALSLLLCVLPVCASAKPPWGLGFILGATEESDCVAIRMTEVYPDGGRNPVVVPDQWSKRWLRCSVRHYKTNCTTWVARTVVKRPDQFYGMRDEIRPYILQLGNWVCPSDVSPPTTQFFDETVLVLDLGLERQGTPLQEPMIVFQKTAD